MLMALSILIMRAFPVEKKDLWFLLLLDQSEPRRKLKLHGRLAHKKVLKTNFIHIN